MAVSSVVDRAISKAGWRTLAFVWFLLLSGEVMLPDAVVSGMSRPDVSSRRLGGRRKGDSNEGYQLGKKSASRTVVKMMASKRPPQANFRARQTEQPLCRAQSRTWQSCNLASRRPNTSPDTSLLVRSHARSKLRMFTDRS